MQSVFPMKSILRFLVILLMLGTSGYTQECFNYATHCDYLIGTLEMPFIGGGNLAVDDARGCVTNQGPWIYALDISIPSDPVLGNSVYVDGEIESTRVSDGYAFIGIVDHRLLIIDLNDVTEPFVVSELSYDEPIKDHFACSSRLAVIAGSELHLYDLSEDITSPVLIQTFDIPNAYGVRLKAGYCAIISKEGRIGFSGILYDDYAMSFIDLSGDGPYSITPETEIYGGWFVPGPDYGDDAFLMEHSGITTCYDTDTNTYSQSEFGYLYDVDIRDIGAPVISNRFSKESTRSVARSDSGLFAAIGDSGLLIYTIPYQGDWKLLNRFRVGTYSDPELIFHSDVLYSFEKGHYPIQHAVIHVLDAMRLADTPRQDYVGESIEWPETHKESLDEKLRLPRYSGLVLSDDVILYKSSQNRSLLFHVDEFGRFHDIDRKWLGRSHQFGNDSLLVYRQSSYKPYCSGVMNWKTDEVLFETPGTAVWADSYRGMLIGDKIICTDEDSTYVYDFSNPGHPVKAWSMSPSLGISHENYVHNGGYIYHVDWDGLTSGIWSVCKTGRLVFVGTLDENVVPQDQYNLKIIKNNLCFVNILHNSDSRLFGLSNPAEPDLIGRCNVPNGMGAIYVDDMIYSVAPDHNDGDILIYDAGNILSPERVQVVLHDSRIESLQNVGNRVIDGNTQKDNSIHH